MKLQNIALGLALAVAGSAFAGMVTRDVTVTRDTPNGTVTRHVVRTSDRDDMYRAPMHRKVVIVNPHHRHVKKVVIVNPHRHMKKVVIVHPAHHGRYAENRTVVIHRSNG